MSKQLMKTLNLKRPKWEDVSKAYKEINEIGKAEYYNTLEKAKQEGLSDNMARHRAELAQAQKRYEKVGGQALREFNRDSESYINTCAFKLSYALNYGGMPLNKYISRQQITSRPIAFQNALILGDKANNNYFMRVKEIRQFLQLKSVWGNADEPYNPKIMKTKQENIDFYNNEFSKFDKSGVVAMIISGWSDAGGHITLWDGANELNKVFLDYDENLYNNYLLYGNSIVTDLYFWELK